MKAEENIGAAREPPLQKTAWAKVMAALWMLGAAAAHYFLWVRALVESVPAGR